MSRSRITLSCIIYWMLICLGGCGVATEQERPPKEQEESATGQEWLSENPVDISQAVEISLVTGAEELNNLLQVDCRLKRGEIDAQTGIYTEIGEFARNENTIFYVKYYGRDGAQNYHLSQIYRYDSDSEEDILLYETAEGVWLNEFGANSAYLYWVEYIYSEEQQIYNVMQYNLSTEGVSCIASRKASESNEICLAVSENYVTWYDGLGDSNLEIAIYDVAKQELQRIQEETVKIFAPYVRLHVVDGGITYFTQDAEDRIFIHRYNLETKQTDILYLGEANVDTKLAECYSSKNYIAWLTEYSFGTYYFYHIESGKLYSLHQTDELRVFSGWLSDCFYVNDSVSGRIYAYDFGTEKIYYQDIAQGLGLSLRPYGEKLYMKVVGDENVEMLTISTNF